jgi:SOS-response transcriptional repressor LexA
MQLSDDELYLIGTSHVNTFTYLEIHLTGMMSYDTGMRVEDIRRHNLIWLIEQQFQGVDVNLARALGIQPSQISRLFSSNPTHRRNIGRALAENIEEAAGKTNGWMDLVHDFVDYSTSESRKRYAVREPRASKPYNNVLSGPTIKRVVPLISWEGVVEMPATYEFSTKLGSYLCPVECSEQTFVLRVMGASMEPRFRDGELIFVDPAVKPEHGKFVIARPESEHEPVFRQLIVEGKRRYLQTLNTYWPERVIELTGNDRLIGVVIFKGEPI